MKKLFIIFSILSSFASGQNIVSINGIARDTSYTLYSAEKKMLKKFPEAILVRLNRNNNIKEESNIVYAKVGKRELHLNIFRPINSKKKTLPGVLMIYGGGWASGDTSLITPMAERLAAEGFVTITPEYRLSPEALYPAAVFDLKAAVRWVRKNAEKYNIDKNKIAAYGCSAGGQLAALLGATNGDKRFEGEEGNLNISSNVQAVVDVDGVVDFFGKGSEEEKDNPNKPSAAHRWFGVSAKDNPKIWKDAGAYNHTTKNMVPIEFINSAVPRFHAGRDEMIQLLNRYNIYNEVHTLPNTIHTFWLFQPWFEDTLRYTVGFLDNVFQSK